MGSEVNVPTPIEQLRAAIRDFEAAMDDYDALRERRGTPDSVPTVMQEGVDETRVVVERAVEAGHAFDRARVLVLGGDADSSLS